MNKKLCLAIVGPTASGKSELAVQIAKKLGGEIISADSRQIYKGMDIGTGKVEGKWRVDKTGKKVFLYKSVPHYLIDEASPRVQYSVVKFQKKARVVLEDIWSRGKLPIICGGTMQWVDALVYDQVFPQVKPDLALRKKLESKNNVEQLFKQLQKLDPARAKTIDSKNPRRLIRALEIVLSTGKPVPQTNLQSPYRVMWIGLNPGMEKLEAKISKRYKQWLRQGMLDEVKSLHASGVSWKRLESFGLEYKYTTLYLRKKITLEEMHQLTLISLRQYAKRQMTWWKRNKNIRWFQNSSDAIEYLQKN